MTLHARLAGLLSLVILGGFSTVLAASPTMVRLGYARCSVCHLAPQGAGLLTDYGQGIDEAQSLMTGERPEQTEPRPLRYDLRLLTVADSTTAATAGSRPTPPLWLRVHFRNSTQVGARNRLASTVLFEAPQGGVARSWTATPHVNVTAAWEYRPLDGITVAVARDRLPRGVEEGETRTILQDGDDADRFPTQLRAFLTSNRFNMTAYTFAPGSAAALDRRARGVGALGEIQFFRNHLVLGASARRALSATMERHTVGGYMRFGIGNWGILAEHELAHRTLASGPDASPRRYAGFTQLFFAPKEWLVTSLIGEQSVEPGALKARTFRWRPELQARLSSSITITASAGNNIVTSMGTSRIYLIQLNVKTLQ